MRLWLKLVVRIEKGKVFGKRIVDQVSYIHIDEGITGMAYFTAQVCIGTLFVDLFILYKHKSTH